MDILELKTKVEELESKNVCKIFRNDCNNCPIFDLDREVCMVTVIDCRLSRYMNEIK